MALRDTTATFGWGSRAFHWVMAIAMLVAATIGVTMTEIESGDPRNLTLDLHTGLGLAVLVLVVLRVVWRLANPTPAPVAGTPLLHVLAAKAAHLALYGLMFALPIAGVLMNWSEGRTIHVFWLHEIPAPYGRDPELRETLELVHQSLAGLLGLIVLAHAGAALWHHFVVRDSTLRRMLTGAAD